MEVSEAVTDADNRERNNRLVPILLSRLRQCLAEEKEEREASRSSFKRPFAVFAASSSSSSGVAQPPNAKMPRRRLSREIAESETDKRKEI